MNDLTVVDHGGEVQSIFQMTPEGRIIYATRVANVLKDVIDKQKLATRIGPNEYVKAEGWSTLGALLGILPVEDEVRRLADGSYEAKVKLVKQDSGTVVGAGSGICSVTEPRWGGAPEYARRSMAITRATGKAYRLGFSWIMQLAGYSPTPEEEMLTKSEKDDANAEEIARLKAEIETLRKDKTEVPSHGWTGTPEQRNWLYQTMKEQNIPYEDLEPLNRTLVGLPKEKILDKIKAYKKEKISEILS